MFCKRLYKQCGFLIIFCLLFFQSVDPASAATYYLTKSSGTDVLRVAHTSSEQTVTNSGFLIGDYKVGSWVSQPLGRTSLTNGTYTFNIWASKSSILVGSGLYAIVKVNSDSGPTIATSNTVSITSTSPQELTLTANAGSSTSVNPTDVLYVELRTGVLSLALGSFGNTVYYNSTARPSRVATPFDGSLSLSHGSSLNLTATTVQPTAVTRNGSLGTVSVVDGRESNVGWNLTVAASTPTCCSGARQIDVTNLQVKTSDTSIQTNFGSATGVSLGSNHSFTSTSDQFSLLTASSGNGSGSYSFVPQLNFTVPVGSYAGSYQTTLTFTLQ